MTKFDHLKEGMIVFKFSDYGFLPSNYFQIYEITEISEHVVFGKLKAEGGEFFGQYSMRDLDMKGDFNIGFNSYSNLFELTSENVKEYGNRLTEECQKLLSNYQLVTQFNKDLKDLL